MSDQFNDEIFKYDGTGYEGKVNFNFEKGYQPHVRKRGLFGSKSYFHDPITPRLNDMSERLREGSVDMGGRAMEFMDAEQATWLEANTRDIQEAYVAKKVAEAKDNRVEAMEDVEGMGRGKRVRNTAEARRNFDRRIQGFRRARKKLRMAEEAGASLGSQVKYNQTGYEMLDPSADKFYDEFDKMLAERRDAYAQKYSGVNYDELGEGFSNIDGVKGANEVDIQRFIKDNGGEGIDFDEGIAGYRLYTNLREKFGPDYNVGAVNSNTMAVVDFFGQREGMFEEYEALGSRAGSKDIDAMVLQDLIGTSAADSAFLETSGIEELDGYMEMTLNTVRDGFAQTFSSAYEGANTRAEMEDSNRMEYANTVERETNATIATGRKRNEESIANQISDIRDAERIAKRTLDAQTSALTDAGTPRKKKVKGVDMQDGRPE